MLLKEMPLTPMADSKSRRGLPARLPCRRDFPPIFAIYRSALVTRAWKSAIFDSGTLKLRFRSPCSFSSHPTGRQDPLPASGRYEQSIENLKRLPSAKWCLRKIVFFARLPPVQRTTLTNPLAAFSVFLTCLLRSNVPEKRAPRQRKNSRSGAPAPKPLVGNLLSLARQVPAERTCGSQNVVKQAVQLARSILRPARHASS